MKKSKKVKNQLKKFIGTLRDNNNNTSDVNKGLENMLYYFDAIWSDRWWDYSYMLNIWNVKFKDMEYNWLRSNYKGKKKDYKTIKKTRKLLKLLIKDNFFDKYEKILTKKYGKLKTKSTKLSNGRTELSFYRTKANINTDEYTKEYKNSLKYAEIDKEKVKIKFFKLIKDNYEKWCD